MSSINTPTNIAFNPNEPDFGPARQANRQREVDAEGVDLDLRGDYAAAIRKALELEDAEREVVLRAQKEISAKEIDTAENIDSAAEGILKFGI